MRRGRFIHLEDDLERRREYLLLRGILEQTKGFPMHKVALLVATLFACGPDAQASTVELKPSAPPAADASCRLAASLDMACAPRIADADAGGNGDTALVDSPGPDAASAVADWDATPASASAGDFKDAAATPGTILHAPGERDRPQPLIPALIALAAMVILLWRRPTSF
jgi:hypothetical protein